LSIEYWLFQFTIYLQTKNLPVLVLM